MLDTAIEQKRSYNSFFMNTKKALEIKKALFTISELLEIEPQELVNSICFLHKERFPKIKQASDLWNEFENADLVNRAKMLGITISSSKLLVKIDKQ